MLAKISTRIVENTNTENKIKNIPSKHTTSQQRRCNVTTLQRRCNDVVRTLCVCWVYILEGLNYTLLQ